MVASHPGVQARIMHGSSSIVVYTNCQSVSPFPTRNTSQTVRVPRGRSRVAGSPYQIYCTSTLRTIACGVKSDCALALQLICQPGHRTGANPCRSLLPFAAKVALPHHVSTLRLAHKPCLQYVRGEGDCDCGVPHTRALAVASRLPLWRGGAESN